MTRNEKAQHKALSRSFNMCVGFSAIANGDAEHSKIGAGVKFNGSREEAVRRFLTHTKHVGVILDLSCDDKDATRAVRSIVVEAPGGVKFPLGEALDHDDAKQMRMIQMENQRRNGRRT